jgi:peptidoglycan/xylan/chitin deacetylase (PgdA/CDA1 family)
VIQIRPQNGEARSIKLGAENSSPQTAQQRSAGQIHSVNPGAGEDLPPNSGKPAKTESLTSPKVASLPPAPARRAAPKNSYNNISTSHPVVAMTFDDGPHPELTPKLLDILKERNIRATFYVIGRNVEAYPEIARRIVEEGHEIANHTYSHPALSKIGASRVKRELDRTTEAIRNATGITPQTMRPPYGATNASLNRRIHQEFSMPVIMWSVDPQDWRYRNAKRVSSHIISHAKSGDIILAHDIHASTIAAMPPALDALLAKGFRFLTVTELLEYDGTVENKTEVAAVEPPATSSN